MSKQKLTWFQTMMVLMANQRGEIRMGFRRHALMDEKDDDKKGGGGGGNSDKNEDGSYKPEFVEKLMREKNNNRDRKNELEKEIEELKKKLEGKGGGDDDKGKKGNQGAGDDDTKALLRAKDEENKKLREQLDGEKKVKADAMKAGALREEFEKNGGDLKKWPLIQKLVDTSKVLIDEDTDTIYGSETEIKRVKELAPELFGKPRKGVDDGDKGGNTTHDDANTGDIKKAVEGKRLVGKSGKDALAAGFQAMGLKSSATRQ